MFDAKLTPYNIAEFCQAMERNEIRVNHDYQRSPRVWPSAAKSFLIETILLGYPMPKLSLHQITDLKTRKTTKEIVDGQQRSMTILEFYQDKLRLGKKALPVGAAGKLYSELEDDFQKRFLDYALSVDLFIGANKDDIREVFRRMNSYTVPLNAEEKRHAKFQGPFKWFVYRLTKSYAQATEDMGIFTEKQLNRMQDAKLFSEIVHAIFNGIMTTKDKELAKLYEDNDKTFADEEVTEKRIRKAMDFVIELKNLHNGALMKPHQMYAYLLAVTHYQMSISKLEPVYKFGKVKSDKSTVVANLARLAAVLEDPDSDRKLTPFFEAGAEKTNVAEQRKARFQWICKALENKLP